MHDIHDSGEAIREALIGFLGPRVEYPNAPAEEATNVKTAAKAVGREGGDATS
jgi:hypothetical protein